MGLFSITYKDLTDEQLVARMSKGDERAFNALYQRYAGPLVNYFMRMLWRDKEKAEDFLHDLFAKLIRNPSYFDVERKFKTWVYSVANNMCKNEYKKMEVRKGMSTGLDDYDRLKDNRRSLEQTVEDSFFAERFEQGMILLDEKHREVFALRHLDGLSIKEIAEILSLNEGTVKSRLFYATRYLAEHLKEFNPQIHR